MSETVDVRSVDESAYTDGVEAPGVGTWLLDASHAPHPICRFTASVLPAAFRLGFGHSFARYGGMLDYVEVGVVKGFLFNKIRPLGAPPDAVGHPPQHVFAEILANSPELQERCRTAETVWAERRWRGDLALWDSQTKPALVARRDELDAVDRSALDDAGLARHLADCHAALADGWVAHHSHNGAAIVPVGDFLAHALPWTRRPMGDLLVALAGTSAVSEGGGAEMEALASAVAADPAAVAVLADAALEPAAALALLSVQSAAITAALRAYAQVAAYLPVDGEDSVGVPTTMEEPALVLGRLRAALAAHATGGFVRSDGDAIAASLRADVPEEFREQFDDLLAEARLVYRLRDERAVYGDRGFGCVARRALLVAGARLTERGLLDAADHAADLELAEVSGLLLSGTGPSAAEVADRVFWRANADYRLMPPLFGPPPGEPLPAEWLPPAAARVHNAFGIALNAVLADAGPSADSGGGPVVVTGIAAGVGVREGRARLIQSAADLHLVEAGDVIVAPATGPAFNLVLPLVAGLVTDRGGLLSHAAIVAREFSLPAVVGCADATLLIPDGARVRIDGTAGTVTVL